MREHPIPQDITNYRFHIVGSMTLKQFGELALGCILAFAVYSSNLIVVVKWPLIGIFVLLGVVAAFVPIAERPLDHWIMTFFKGLYKPTLFYWVREEKIPEPFLFKPNIDVSEFVKEVDLGPARRERIIEYMRSINSSYTVRRTDEYSQQEMEQIQQISHAFDSVVVPSSLMLEKARKIPQKPHLSVNIRKLNPTIGTKVLKMKKQEDGNLETKGTVVFEESHFTPDHHKTVLQSDQVAQEVVIPDYETISVEKEQAKNEDVITTQGVAKDQAFIESTSPEANVATEQTHFNASLPFPTRPTEPNKLVGMVLTPDNNLVTDAIVEVQTPDGHIVRAVKTNALGQFFITTALKNGEYVLHVEKPNFEFSTLSISLKGNVVEPIEIRSR